MREILFRGKRIDNGEWVEGYYVETLRYNNLHWIWDGKEYIAVDPSTVGQYTGINDRNGKRIFEQDIVAGVDYDADDGFGVVCWNDGSFEVGNGSWCGTFHENYFGRDFEVIGNIHDNPDLLEVYHE